MPNCPVVVMAFGFILPLCTHSQGHTNQPPMDLSDYSFTVNSTVNFTVDGNATDSPDINQEFGARASTDGPVGSTVQTPIIQTIQASDGCTCNITPDFCDIGCCCDVVDCGIADLSSVFSDCRQETRAGVCIESWLIFRANVDPQLVTDTGSLFCVQRGNDSDSTAQNAPAASEGPSIFSPHFSLSEVNSTQNTQSSSVYKVEYMITYTSAGEITAAMVQGSVTNANFGTQILQQHTVKFQLATPSSSPPKLPLVGLEVGTPVIGWFGGQAGPLTMPGLSLGGECSIDLTNRTPILLMHNSITGCTFRSMLHDCASLRAQIYSILRGTMTPDTVAMTAGSQPQQSRVIVQECPEPAPGEVCKTGCLVPVSLSVRFLWIRRGMLALPQNHILGVKYVFNCQILKCPIVSPLPVTTEVIFLDTTVYPEPPWAKPHPGWKFPFGFFTRGAEELDRI
ncbi:tectonic-3-like isoform X2 [Neoarius graeffei]|uniref:tectonic-3-like isoform X2 n=1 Tax=Neoarius graeffei TaxID=443677 RepID=UPI00298D24AE|nr:tectonic-3-like isoform X2 [Neoarius graeffei]